MTIVYHEEHGDLHDLSGKLVGVIGYGNLGRPFAFNLRDSGLNVMIGGRTEERREEARADGFVSAAVDQVVKQTQILLLLMPDEVMPQFYLEQISPYLQRGHTLIFGSAYNVAFGFIEAPPFVDVGLIAPRILGAAVRERYQQQQGFVSFVAVGQDASGKAWNTVLALAQALGALRGGAVEVSFEQESELDLFTQQAILPAFHHLITKAASLLIGKGYPPEAVLAELYLSGEFSYYLQQVERLGLLNTQRLAALTSQYGTLSRIERFNDLKLERLMEVTLDEIHSGDFAQEWAREYADSYRRLNMLYKNLESLELNDLEQQTLDLLGRTDDFDA